MSDLRIIVDPRLPPLAWLLRWDVSSATLLAGDRVETTATSWVEGCWDSDFHAMVPEGHWLTGTAGRLEAGRLTLTPPFHSFDAIHLLRRDGSLFASNSLPFLVEASGARFRRHHVNLHTDLAKVVYGLDRPHLRIPMAGGDILETLHLLPVTVELSTSGEQYCAYPDAPGFVDFDSYHRFLRERIRLLVANATSTARKAALRPVTTVSSGYDSSAAAALAREVSATTALTISRSRGSGDSDGDDDSGAVVAEALGLTTRTFERDTRWSVDGEPFIAEFLASGMSGEELPLRVLADDLREAILLSGYYGDSTWSRIPGRARRLQRGDLGGSSLTEFRLRVGFSHLPVPFLGAARQHELAEISCSEQMVPWSVGGSYDRPIPRRIAESAGVPRESFGITKMAVTSVAGRRTIADPAVTEAVRSFDRARHGSVVRLATAARAGLLTFLQPSRVRLEGANRRIAGDRSSRAPIGVARRRSATLHGPHAVPTFLWALDLIGRTRYRTPLESLPPPATDHSR